MFCVGRNVHQVIQGHTLVPLNPARTDTHTTIAGRLCTNCTRQTCFVWVIMYTKSSMATPWCPSILHAQTHTTIAGRLCTNCTRQTCFVWVMMYTKSFKATPWCPLILHTHTRTHARTHTHAHTHTRRHARTHTRTHAHTLNYRAILCHNLLCHTFHSHTQSCPLPRSQGWWGLASSQG